MAGQDRPGFDSSAARTHPFDEEEKIKLTFYMGQNVEGAEPRSGSEEKQR